MIVREGHPILSKVCEPWVFGEPHDASHLNAQFLANRMRAAMEAERGLGLAAPQIGHAYRAFVLADTTIVDGAIACFNPVILERLDGMERGQEGCLSYPGVFLYVRRHRRIKARFQDHDGLWREREFTGQQARAFQHELDHLDGRTLPDFVPAQAFALAKAKARKAA